MSKDFLFISLICALLGFSCGGGTVNIDQTYEPKIVIQGTLFPQQRAEVKIMRNFPLGTVVDRNKIVIRDARVVIFEEDRTQHNLRFNINKQSYEQLDPNLVIDYGKTYTLEVDATIDGQQLSAKSTTRVPQAGFEILESKSVLDSMVYREKDENDEVKLFDVRFNRSPGIDFYAISILAIDADTSTFVYDNPFGDLDADDVLDDFDDFRYAFNWIQDTPLEAGESHMEIFWFFTWFYGKYQAIIYAGDKNFKDFLVTHDQVQEIDGNYHEPAFHFEGDGIGVFGSAIADTVNFWVLRE